MHRNYFLFREQIKFLAPQIVGQMVKSAFTYRKNELVLELEPGNSFIKISVDVAYPYILRTGRQNIRQNVMRLFPQLNHQVIKALTIQPADKQIELVFDTFKLLAIFYGKGPNIVLVNYDHQLVAQFKDRPYHSELNATSSLSAPGPLFASQDKQLQRENDKIPLIQLIKQNYYAFNKTLLREFAYRCELDIDAVCPLQDAVFKNKFDGQMLRLAKELEFGAAFHYYRDDVLQKISLVRLHHLEHEVGIRFETYDDLNHAWNKFIGLHQEARQRENLRQKCRAAAEKRLSYLSNALAKVEAAEDIQARKEVAELKGNLLLTNKMHITPGVSEVVLENIFDGSLDKIKIKLNPNRSVVENANRYFEKFKNSGEKAEVLQIKKETLKRNREEMQNLLTQIAKANYQRLATIYRQLIDMQLIQDPVRAKQQTGGLQYAFRHLILERAWDVFIGKNGPNNDLLTFDFAKKWDLWLHAQGVPGSHVIIRCPRKDLHPPQKVLLQAAQIAAAHSRARNSATVPVMYTEVRYVSRVRKALPGTVQVKNEQVLFVKPMEIS